MREACTTSTVNLGQRFEVQAIVKLGANTESKANTINSDLTRFTKKDVNIIWGGTRDVAKMRLK